MPFKSFVIYRHFCTVVLLQKRTLQVSDLQKAILNCVKKLKNSIEKPEKGMATHSSILAWRVS